MKEKIVIAISILLPMIILMGVTVYYETQYTFMGVYPKATHENYRIYDIVEQKQLICAEALEFIGRDAKYDYYLPCIKSSRIYFVSSDEVINIKEAYEKKIITLEKLYELDIVDRVVRSYGR